MPAVSRSRRLVLGLIAASLAACVTLSGALAYRALRQPGGARLVAVRMPSLERGPCPGSRAPGRTGPAFRLVTEWHIATDPVGVLGRFTSRGWDAVSNAQNGFANSGFELVPSQPQVARMWTAQLRVYRGLSLTYTEEQSTRMQSSMAVVFCSF